MSFPKETLQFGEWIFYYILTASRFIGCAAVPCHIFLQCRTYVAYLIQFYADYTLYHLSLSIPNFLVRYHQFELNLSVSLQLHSCCKCGLKSFCTFFLCCLALSVCFSPWGIHKLLWVKYLKPSKSPKKIGQEFEGHLQSQSSSTSRWPNLSDFGATIIWGPQVAGPLVLAAMVTMVTMAIAWLRMLPRRASPELREALVDSSS